MLMQIFYRLMLIIFAMASLAGCLAEASFELAPDSRLPKWFSVAEGSSRSDFKVIRDDYAYPGTPESVFKLYKKDSFFRLKKVSGTIHIVKGSPKEFPIYAAFTIDGITDIIEQKKMEPVFYMVDDPVVWKEWEVLQKASM